MYQNTIYKYKVYRAIYIRNLCVCVCVCVCVCARACARARACTHIFREIKI